MIAIKKLFLPVALAFLFPSLAAAQGAEVAFGGLKLDSSQPVEVASDQLSVNQGDGSAVFSGNVEVAQGEMRLSAARLEVTYAQSGGNIERMVASGGITFVNGTDAIEAQEAVYSLSDGRVVMTGDVILTQARSAISGQRLVIDLDAGTGVMEGRVKTILQTGQ